MTGATVSPDGIAFSAAVQAVQQRRGSRSMFADAEWPADITPELSNFIAAQTSVFLATASADGQPHIQHRGGPPGFLKVLDNRTIGFADFRGNQQYITLGNLSENDRAHLFLMDYAHRRRVKLWGRAKMIEGDRALIEKLMPENYRAKADQALLFTVDAWNVNCQQHIPQRIDAGDVLRAIEDRDQRIKQLEDEVATLRQQLAVSDACGDDGWDKVLK